MKKNILFLSSILFSSTIFAQFAASPSNWDVPKGGNLKSGINEIEGDYSNNGKNNWATLDLNGDGKLDLIFTSTTGNKVFDFGSAPYWEVYLNSGNGFSKTATNWSVPSGGLDNVGFNKLSGISTKVGEESWSTMDINGDGKPDLVLTSYYHNTANKNVAFDQGSKPKWKVYLNTGNGFAASIISWAVPKSGDIKTGITYLNGGHSLSGGDRWSTMDMNGDTKPDLVLHSRKTPGNYIVWGQGSEPFWNVYFNTGYGFADTAVKWSVPEGGSSTTGFNNTNGSVDETDGNTWSVVDVNGDLKPDLILTAYYKSALGQIVFGVTSVPYWKIYLNTGAGFSKTFDKWDIPKGGSKSNGINKLAGSGSEKNGNTWNFIDMDGDKKPELVLTSFFTTVTDQAVFGHGVKPYWEVYKNLGTRFYIYPSKWEVPATGSDDGLINIWGEGSTTGSNRWITMDMDGDSKSELVLTSLKSSVGGHTAFAYSSNPYWRVYKNDGNILSIDSKVNGENNIVLYPNPTTNGCTINLDKDITNGNIKIYNISGAIVYSEAGIEKNQVTVDLSHLQAGIYFVEVEDEDSRCHYKVIKE